MLFQIGDREFDPPAGFVGDKPAQLRLQARIVLDAPLSLQSGKPDRAPPAVPRLDRRRMLQLHQVLDYPNDLATERRALRYPQILDLLGEVFPVQRLVRATAPGSAQSLGLLLRPGGYVLFVERFQIRHDRLNMGLAALRRKLSRPIIDACRNLSSRPSPTIRG